MKVRVPYFRSKRYLTGIDWVVGTLDHMTRRSVGKSNASQIVLELESPLPEARLREALDRFTPQFPVLNGRPSRDITICPYWKFPAPGAVKPARIEVLRLDAGASRQDVLNGLARAVNAPFANDAEHLVFHLVHIGDQRSFAVMTFDHRLFDARGAESFLDLLQRSQGEDVRERIGRIALTEPAHLEDWKNKFEAGRHVNRMVLSLTQAKPAFLPRTAGTEHRPFRFGVFRFGTAASKAVVDSAYREAGYLMVMPYVLALVIQLMHRAFIRKGVVAPDYIISVSLDLRQPERVDRDLFFNHVSFLFFRVPAELASRRKDLLDSVKRQMYEQVKSGFPQHLAEASMLMRILPQSVLARIVRMPLKGEFASFGFSFVGKSVYTSAEFLGARVGNLFHMPIMPVPPGIGVVVNEYQGGLNAVLSHVEGMLSDADVCEIESDLADVFGVQPEK